MKKNLANTTNKELMSVLISMLCGGKTLTLKEIVSIVSPSATSLGITDCYTAVCSSLQAAKGRRCGSSYYRVRKIGRGIVLDRA